MNTRNHQPPVRNLLGNDSSKGGRAGKDKQWWSGMRWSLALYIQKPMNGFVVGPSVDGLHSALQCPFSPALTNAALAKDDLCLDPSNTAKLHRLYLNCNAHAPLHNHVIVMGVLRQP